MPRRSQRATQSDDEHSTPPTLRSPNHESHGRIEAWFEDHEDIIQVFLIGMNRKQISIPKVLRFSWLRVEGFESLFQQLKHQKLKSFLELSGKIYPDLVKVFFTNLEFKMMSYCPTSRVFKWKSTRELGKMWLDSNQ